MRHFVHSLYFPCFNDFHLLYKDIWMTWDAFLSDPLDLLIPPPCCLHQITLPRTLIS